jgi:hypothetical protein
MIRLPVLRHRCENVRWIRPDVEDVVAELVWQLSVCGILATTQCSIQPQKVRPGRESKDNRVTADVISQTAPSFLWCQEADV